MLGTLIQTHKIGSQECTGKAIVDVSIVTVRRPIAATCQASLLAAKRNTLVGLVGCESDRSGGSDASGGPVASGGSIGSDGSGKFG